MLIVPSDRASAMREFESHIRACTLCPGSPDRITRIRGSTKPTVLFVTGIPGQPEESVNLPGVSDEFELLQAMLWKHAGFECSKHAAFVPLVFCVAPRPPKSFYEGCAHNVRRVIQTLRPRVVALCGDDTVRWVLSKGSAPVSMEMCAGRPLYSRDWGTDVLFFVFPDPSKLYAASDDETTREEYVTVCKRFAKLLKSLRRARPT